ncbi:uncharacterized protein LOC116645561 [Phoca vitulina]|uniref:uncharacterized protein LOC116645561 n=1 Tax=Phoca vitulina TaxID=9720 RepID=UPI0013962A97|nr:uncharacterized protein LOC116645561 [Phoca vitulina]
MVYKVSQDTPRSRDQVACKAEVPVAFRGLAGPGVCLVTGDVCGGWRWPHREQPFPCLRCQHRGSRTGGSLWCIGRRGGVCGHLPGAAGVFPGSGRLATSPVTPSLPSESTPERVSVVLGLPQAAALPLLDSTADVAAAALGPRGQAGPQTGVLWLRLSSRWPGHVAASVVHTLEPVAS